MTQINALLLASKPNANSIICEGKMVFCDPKDTYRTEAGGWRYEGKIVIVEFWMLRESRAAKIPHHWSGIGIC